MRRGLSFVMRTFTIRRPLVICTRRRGFNFRAAWNQRADRTVSTGRIPLTSNRSRASFQRTTSSTAFVVRVKPAV
ncbi:MAG: hypothetical protein ABR583_02875 [Gaiellaceae bacterium]